MKNTISNADRLFLTALRASATPPGPCGCLFNLYYEHFHRDGVGLLGYIFALERLLRLLPTRKFRYLDIDAETLSADEAVIVDGLALTQANQQDLREQNFHEHFNTKAPRMLRDLLDDIAGTFDHHSLAFSPLLALPDMRAVNWDAMQLQ